MANAMKIPFPKDAYVEESTIHLAVSYANGEKSYFITWEINSVMNYTVPRDSIISRSFTLSDDDGGTLAWCLAFVRSRSRVNSRICYYLFPCFLPENDRKKVFVKIELTFQDASSKEYATSVGEICKFDAREESSSVSLCIDDRDVASHATVYCKITLPNLPKFKLSKDFGDLFKSQNFTDVKLLSNDGKVFQAHKLILSARSSVFAAMFTHQMIENEQQEVKIADMNGELVKDMLRYIYTDKSEKLAPLAKDLLVAADKYDLKGLKNMCEDVLIENLSCSNAIEILSFSELYKATRLKTEVIRFITTEKNVKVFNNEAWKSLEPPSLYREICEAFANR